MELIMVIWRCCWWRWNAEWWEDPEPRPTALEGLSEVGQLDTLPPYRQPLYSLPPPLPSPSIQITNILLHHFKWHLHLQELSGWWMNTRPACRQPILNPQSSLTLSLDPSFGFLLLNRYISTLNIRTQHFNTISTARTQPDLHAGRNSVENWKRGFYWYLQTLVRGYKTPL